MGPACRHGKGDAGVKKEFGVLCRVPAAGSLPEDLVAWAKFGMLTSLETYAKDHDIPSYEAETFWQNGDDCRELVVLGTYEDATDGPVD